MSNEIDNMEYRGGTDQADDISAVANESPAVSENPENPGGTTTETPGYITIVKSDASDSEASGYESSTEKSIENQSPDKASPGKEDKTFEGPGTSWCYGKPGTKVLGVVQNAIKFEPLSVLDVEVYEGLLTAWRTEIGPRIRQTLEDTCSTPPGLNRLKSSVRKFCQRRGVRTVWDRFIELMTTEKPVIDIIRNESKIVVKYVNRISGRLTRESNTWEWNETGIEQQAKVSSVWSQEELKVCALVLADWRVKLEPLVKAEGLSNLCNRMDQKRKRSKDICCSILNGEREIASLIKNDSESLILFSLRVFAGILHKLDGNEVSACKRPGPAQVLDESKLGSSYVGRKDAAFLANGKPNKATETLISSARKSEKARKIGKTRKDGEIHAKPKRNKGMESLIAARKIGKARKIAVEKRKKAIRGKKMRRSVLGCKEEANLMRFVRNLTQDGFTVPKTFLVGFVNRVLNNPIGVDLNWIESLVKSNQIELKSSAEFEAIGRTMFS